MRYLFRNFNLTVVVVFIFFGFIIASLLLYIYEVRRRTSFFPKMHFKESSLTIHILKSCRLTSRQFRPSWYLSNRHIQTISSYLGTDRSIEFDREYLQLRDRGVVALDWMLNVPVYKRKRCTVLIILPGLTSGASNVTHLCKYAASKGYRPVVFNPRGFGDSILTTHKILAPGDPQDLKQVVKYIHGRYPKVLVTLIGIGTGCCLQLSYLGEYGSSAKISAGACISPCFDPVERFSRGIRSVYDLLYIIKLKITLGSHSKHLEKCFHFNELLKCWSFRVLDEIVYSKLYKFSNIEEFWDRYHPLRDVDEIAVPLLFINSLDDPFNTGSNIPYDMCKYYPHFLMVTTERGGHCGFVDRFGDVSWADKLAVDYLDSVLEFTNKGHSINYGKCVARSTI